MKKKKILIISLIGILLISLILISTSLTKEDEKDYVNLSEKVKDEKEINKINDKEITRKKEENILDKEIEKKEVEAKEKNKENKENKEEVEIDKEEKNEKIDKKDNINKDKNIAKIEKNKENKKEIDVKKEKNNNKKEETNKKETTKEKEEIIEEPKEEKTINISFDMTKALENIDLLSEEKRKFIPQSGYLLSLDNVVINEGDSVFDITVKVLEENGIQVEYEYTPAFDAYYLEGINNIYEFDFGDNSGWIFEVNNERVNIGSSSYILNDGDSIVWKYVI